LKYDKSIIIKPKIGGPPLAIFSETLDPPPFGILAKTSSTPHLGFQPMCIYVTKVSSYSNKTYFCFDSLGEMKALLNLKMKKITLKEF
jgi:hypothetical protein